MTRFKLEFDTQDSAIATNGADEVVRIIRKIADKIESGQYDGRVLDINGNSIGCYGKYKGNISKMRPTIFE